MFDAIAVGQMRSLGFDDKGKWSIAGLAKNLVLAPMTFVVTVFCEIFYPSRNERVAEEELERNLKTVRHIHATRLEASAKRAGIELPDHPLPSLEEKLDKQLAKQLAKAAPRDIEEAMERGKSRFLGFSDGGRWSPILLAKSFGRSLYEAISDPASLIDNMNRELAADLTAIEERQGVRSTQEIGNPAEGSFSVPGGQPTPSWTARVSHSRRHGARNR